MYTGSQSINGRNKNSSVSLVFIRKPSPGNGLSVSGRRMPWQAGVCEVGHHVPVTGMWARERVLAVEGRGMGSSCCGGGIGYGSLGVALQHCICYLSVWKFQYHNCCGRIPCQACRILDVDDGGDLSRSEWLSLH